MTRKQCNIHKSSEAGIESWTNTRKSTQGNHGEAWLKPCIHMNTKLRKKVKNGFEKGFLKLMKNWEDNGENERKYRRIKLVTTDR